MISYLDNNYQRLVIRLPLTNSHWENSNVNTNYIPSKHFSQSEKNKMEKPTFPFWS